MYFKAFSVLQVLLLRKQNARSSTNFLFTESMKKTQEAIRKCAVCFCGDITSDEDRYAQEVLSTEIETLKRTIKEVTKLKTALRDNRLISGGGAGRICVTLYFIRETKSDYFLQTSWVWGQIHVSQDRSKRDYLLGFDIHKLGAHLQPGSFVDNIKTRTFLCHSYGDRMFTSERARFFSKIFQAPTLR